LFTTAYFHDTIAAATAHLLAIGEHPYQRSTSSTGIPDAERP
jgi:hypothetical protein